MVESFESYLSTVDYSLYIQPVRVMDSANLECPGGTCSLCRETGARYLHRGGVMCFFHDQ